MNSEALLQELRRLDEAIQLVRDAQEFALRHASGGDSWPSWRVSK